MIRSIESDSKTYRLFKPYVPQKDFIKTNAANARRSIVLKREAKKVIHKNGDITEAENTRRPSVAKPSVSHFISGFRPPQSRTSTSWISKRLFQNF